MGAIAGLMLAVASHSACAGPCVSASTGQQVEEHIHRLIEALPPDSRWRDMLQHGARGDGIHHPWMDDMRKDRVKLAVFTFEFTWTQRGKQRADWTVVERDYFCDYDRSEPITDEGSLAQLKADGLEQDLELAALARAKTACWFEYPAEERGVGYRQVYLADDEWLPVNLLPFLGRYEPGSTPLIRAAMLGNVARINKLLAEGANVNAVARDGSTPLIWAASSGDPAAVEALLKAGANVNANPKGHGNALLAAVANGRTQNVRILLDAGADPNSRNADGESALWIATRQHSTDIVQLLEHAGAHE